MAPLAFGEALFQLARNIHHNRRDAVG